MYEQESSRKYVGYAYGSPRQHGGDEISGPGGAGAGGTAAPPPNVAGNPGCMGFLLGIFAIGIFQMWEYRKVEKQAEVSKYKADRELDSVVAQVTGRLKDAMYHIDHGLTPGATLHDMDRTGATKSLDIQPNTMGAKVNMGGYTPTPNFDPFKDVELDENDYNFRESDT